jgi:carotenoid cleavage dioxygenase-like enzyme
MAELNRRFFLTQASATVATVLGKMLLSPLARAAEQSVPASVMSASRTELDETLEVRSGAIPADLKGHLFWVAPMPQGQGTHTFNGDGMVYRVDFGAASQPRIKSRLLRTPCYYVDRAVKGFPHGFSNRGVTRFSITLGARNQLNTALLPMRDRLLVTFDAGRPWEIDPQSLDLVTPVGWNDEWKAAPPQIPGITKD